MTTSTTTGRLLMVRGGAAEVDLLIKTKLHAPPLRPDLLARPHLLARLHAGLQGPLTLIAAPAGFGKTTLALAGLAAQPGSTAWLSLDEGDNDSTRFLAYLLAALQAADPGLQGALAELLAGPQPAPPPLVLAQIVNHVAGAGEPVTLVLDDYHVIQTAGVHAMVSFLLEHAPPHLHLVLITRADPPLPLSRLRARGQLVELRAADLRFTRAEVAAFFNAVMRLGLAADLVAQLEERTEGWIAGMQLAALRLRSQSGGQSEGQIPGQTAGQADDAAAFVRAFSGTHRYILDYLLEEVLDRQPPAVQRFLLLTAPLPRLCGPLCDAVLQAAAQAAPETPGPVTASERHASVGDGETQAPVGAVARGEQPASALVLAGLERANVFLAPLDDERCWYRYHHLFADLLRAKLRERYPALAPAVHAAAAAWLEEQGCIAEAVDAALAAGDPQWAARLVEQNTVGLLAAGELAALLGWIGLLPLAVRRQRPWLCVQQAYALAFAGQLSEAAALQLVDREPLPNSSPQTPSVCQTLGVFPTAGAAIDREQAPAPRVEPDPLSGAILAVRAMLAVMGGNEEQAIALAGDALALLPTGAHWDRAAAYWALGYAQRSLGDLAAARDSFAEQIRLARLLDNVWTLATGLTDLALVLRTQGELRQARTLLEEALYTAARQGARSRGYMARMETGLAAILYEQNELDAAEQLLHAAVARLRQWPNPNHVAFAYLLLARVQRARGAAAAADAALAEAYQAGKTGPLTKVLQRLVEAELVRQRPGRSQYGGASGGSSGGSGANSGSDASGKPAAVAAWVAAADELAEQWWQRLAGAPDGAWDEAAELAVLALAQRALDADASAALLPLLERAAAGAQQAGRVGAQIEALALLARARHLLGAGGGRQPLADLELALRLAQPRGYRRVLLDLGQPLPLLLAQWLAAAGEQPLRVYAAGLLAEFGGPAPVTPVQIPAQGEPPAATPQAALPAPVAPPAPAGPQWLEPLSRREREVLALLAQGLTNHEIAARLIVAPGTVKAHTAAIYRKLDVANRTEAAARARGLGIL